MRLKPKVLIWTENYWVGGCDRFLADLARGLPAGAVDLLLAGNPHPAFDSWLATHTPGLLPRITVPIANLVNSPVARLWQHFSADLQKGGASLARGGNEPRSPSFIAAGVAVWRYRQAAANYVRLRTLLRQVRPDVLHVNNGGYPGGESCRMAVLAARAERVPRVVQFVHNMAYPPAFPASMERLIDRRVDAATHCWVTAAHRASQWLVDSRELTSPIRTVHYGVSAAPDENAADLPSSLLEFGFSKTTFNLAVVANLESRKGHPVLIEALAMLRSQGVRVRAACVGGGAERSALESLVQARGLAADVRFLGWRQDVPRLLASADALVLPSLSNECLPYAILEAMARGLPVVSTDVAGIPEMVDDGHTGLLVSPGDSRAIAQAIQRLSSAPIQARDMGLAGHARVLADFTIDRMVRQMIEIWTGDVQC